MGFTLPPIFQPPNPTGTAPKACCCTNPGKVTVNVGDIGTGFGANGVETRQDAADRLLAEARKKGVVIFQGM